MSCMFSSIRVTECPGGVKAASNGRQATGMLARLPISGRACSRPQYETSNRGLIRMMSAMGQRTSSHSTRERFLQTSAASSDRPTGGNLLPDDRPESERSDEDGDDDNCTALQLATAECERQHSMTE